MLTLHETKSFFNSLSLSEAHWKASRSSIRAVFGRLGGLSWAPLRSCWTVLGASLRPLRRGFE
eukprot:1766200-Pyramimonas_sp.AAC.1